MKKIFIFILITLILTACQESPNLYEQHTEALSTLDAYKITLDYSSSIDSPVHYSRSYSIYMDNINGIVYFKSDEFDQVDHILKFSLSKTFGYYLNDDTWERYEIIDGNNYFEEDDIIMEMVSYCEEEDWNNNEYTGINICETNVRGDYLGEAIIDFLGVLYPDNPERYSFEVGLTFSAQDQYFTHVELHYDNLYNSYVQEHPNYTGVPYLSVSFESIGALDLHIPSSYVEKTYEISYESFMAK